VAWFFSRLFVQKSPMKAHQWRKIIGICLLCSSVLLFSALSSRLFLCQIWACFFLFFFVSVGVESERATG
jgi:hypothetical protein